MKRLLNRLCSGVSFVRAVIVRFLSNNGSMHAAGLTYFALLAVVPVLCCVLVAAKACRVDDYARRQINTRLDALIVQVEQGQDDQLARLASFDGTDKEKKRIAAAEFGKTARQISNALFERVEAFDIATFGWIGFGLLLWTVISSLASVETSFNEFFGVTRARPLWKRCGLYLFILVALPVMAAVVLSLPVLGTVRSVMTATVGQVRFAQAVSDGLLWLLDARFFRFALTLLSSSLFFGFFYWVLPNCRVRKRHAWLGGFVTALAFGGWVRLCAIAQIGIAKSSALYGSFAFLPIVLAWLYVSWQIVLAGACFVKEVADRGQGGSR